MKKENFFKNYENINLKNTPNLHLFQGVGLWVGQKLTFFQLLPFKQNRSRKKRI